MASVRLILASLALVALATSANPQPSSAPRPSPSPVIQSHETATENHPKVNKGQPPEMVQSPFQIAILEALRTIARQQQAAQAEDQANDKRWWPPSPSWAIVYVTVIYVFVAIFQWAAIRRQANIAKQTLLLQFRPHLIVRNVVLTAVTERPSGETYELRRGDHVRGQFYVANIGDSAATIKESLCVVDWRSGGLPMRRPYEGKAGNNPVKGRIEPGQRKTGFFESDRPLDVEPIAIVEPKDRRSPIEPLQHVLSLYVMGWVEYVDDLGFERRTAFCRWLNPIRHYFVPVENPDYEHEE